MSNEKPSSGQPNRSTLLAELKRAVTAIILESDIRQYMPQAAPTTAAIFDKVHAFARRLRLLLLTALLLYLCVGLGLSALSAAILAPVARTLAVGVSVTLAAYYLFLWVRFYGQTRLLHYLLGEHWCWTAWLLIWPLSWLSALADVVAGILFVGLIFLGEIWRRQRATRLAAEVRTHLGQWEVLSVLSIKEMALGRFHSRSGRA